jgi:hypothetical protein
MPIARLIDPFRDYADRVVGSLRFGQDEKTRGFIEEVLATAERNVLQIEPGHRFWRAQLGHDDIVRVPNENGEWDYDSIRPHTPERMTPSPKFVGNGRANPVGIAYWYGATDPETALAEMRPWQEARLTVAELTATRSLRFVDFGNVRSIAALRSSEFERDERYVWKSIGDAFSRPVAPGAIDVEHVPTQMLAERFRMKGFDGIQYKSHLGEGMNVVVFDLSAFEIGERGLWTAKRVSYEFEPHGDEIRQC